jgi:predicted AAA+ superfamily ATPase
LKGKFSNSKLDQLSQPSFNPTAQMLDILFEEFDHYIVHGGFLTAINDVAKQNSVSPTTLATYSDWIRGDMLKRGKQENYLRELLSAIIDRYSSQVTWNVMFSHILYQSQR